MSDDFSTFLEVSVLSVNGNIIIVTRMISEKRKKKEEEKINNKIIRKVVLRNG